MIDCQHQTHFPLNHQMIQVGTALESYDDIIASEAGKFFSGVKSGRFSNLQAMI